MRNDATMLTVATNATAPRPVRGSPASQRMSRAAGGDVATTYPVMATKAICMVNGIRLQNPSPNARETTAGEAPLTSAAAATTTSATAANTYASVAVAVGAEP